MSETALVIGASGFLGSHVTKVLAAQGYKVRILVRANSDTRATDHLNIDRFTGDIMDRASLEQAMQGCDWVFHCAVDARSWLRDPSQLYRTNVDGLVISMDAALARDVKRFIFTSTIGTIGRNPSGVATEADVFNWWDGAPDYIRSRVAAENKLFEYCRDKGLPGIACCVANTYGDWDIQPTPQGRLIMEVARKRMFFSWKASADCIGVKDAAEGMVLTAQKGRIGERYILASEHIVLKDLFAMAAEAGGVPAPKIDVPLWLMYIITGIKDFIARLLKIDNSFTPSSVKLSYYMNKMDSTKARTELGWNPAPVKKSVNEAIHFYRNYKRIMAERKTQ